MTTENSKPAPHLGINPDLSPPLHDSESELARRVAENAYRKAEQRGFEPGHEMDDWLAAEREVSANLAMDRC
jgi:hypothetical protein